MRFLIPLICFMAIVSCCQTGLAAQVNQLNKRHARGLTPAEQQVLHEKIAIQENRRARVNPDKLRILQGDIAAHDKAKITEEPTTVVEPETSLTAQPIPKIDPMPAAPHQEFSSDDSVVRGQNKPLRRIQSAPARIEKPVTHENQQKKTVGQVKGEITANNITSLEDLPDEMHEEIAARLDAETRQVLARVSHALVHVDNQRTVIIDMAKTAGRDRNALYRLLQKSAYVTLRHVTVLDMKDMLPHMHNVKSLKIQGVAKRQEVNEIATLIAASTTMRNLIMLDYSGNLLGDTGLQAIAHSSNLAGLEELDLHLNRITDKGLSDLAASPHMANLRVINLSINKIKGSGLQKLASSVHMQGLRILNLSTNTIGVEGVQALANSPYLAGLLELNLGSNSMMGDGGMEAIATSRYLTNLTALNMRNTNLTSEAILALSKSTGMKNLVFLNISKNSIKNTGLKALAVATNLPNLTGLVLQETRLKGEEGVVALAKSTHRKNLTYLDLSENEIGDKGVAALTQGNLIKLVYLSFEGCSLANDGGEAIAQTTQWSALQTLNLTRNDISEAVREKIRARFPFATFI